MKVAVPKRITEAVDFLKHRIAIEKDKYPLPVIVVISGFGIDGDDALSLMKLLGKDDKIFVIIRENTVDEWDIKIFNINNPKNISLDELKQYIKTL